MTVDEGTFQLYSFIDPPIPAGEYRFRTDQLLSGTIDGGTKAPADLPVDRLDTFVRIRAPRYQLPPDQALSTYPPANSQGAYGSRLPQIVIKRRTLPWERDLAGQPSTTPWLALVLIAEGEAELKLNQPVAQCVTPGVVLGGVVDSALGGYLQVRKSMIDKVFPTRKDVPLLAHAREVDIHDTELMMGDDDGFLAVIVANRLPLAGRDATGAEVPVKYLACLINLEGQFDALRPEAPPPNRFTHFDLIETEALSVADWDHVVSGHGRLLSSQLASGVIGPQADGPDLDGPDPDDPDPDASGPNADGQPASGPHADGPLSEGPRTVRNIRPQPPVGAQAYSPTAQWSLEDEIAGQRNVYAEMAADFAIVADDVRLVNDVIRLDPTYRFPVLLHWSFTSIGSTTFRLLMEQLDSGLLGTLPDPPRPPSPGRPPIEIVETGHVGLPHRTRRGDEVRAWYRGPLVPHPTQDPPSGRLALAHAADQLRIVVPDGREDLSLAAAFEIGRLLALSRPAIVGSLLRWRQTGYQAARRRSIWDANRGLLGELLADLDGLAIDRDLYVHIGREFVNRVAPRPGDLLGPPRAMFDPGRPIEHDGTTLDLIATGFGVNNKLLSGSPLQMLDNIRAVEVPVAGDFADRLNPKLVSVTLRTGLESQLIDLVSDTLAPEFQDHRIVGPTIPRSVPRSSPRRDRLDELLLAGDGSADDRANDFSHDSATEESEDR